MGHPKFTLLRGQKGVLVLNFQVENPEKSICSFKAANKVKLIDSSLFWEDCFLFSFLLGTCYSSSMAQQAENHSIFEVVNVLKSFDLKIGGNDIVLKSPFSVFHQNGTIRDP